MGRKSISAETFLSCLKACKECGVKTSNPGSNDCPDCPYKDFIRTARAKAQGR